MTVWTVEAERAALLEERALLAEELAENAWRPDTWVDRPDYRREPYLAMLRRMIASIDQQLEAGEEA